MGKSLVGVLKAHISCLQPGLKGQMEMLLILMENVYKTCVGGGEFSQMCP